MSVYPEYNRGGDSGWIAFVVIIFAVLLMVIIVTIVLASSSKKELSEEEACRKVAEFKSITEIEVACLKYFPEAQGLISR